MTFSEDSRQYCFLMFKWYSGSSTKVRELLWAANEGNKAFFFYVDEHNIRLFKLENAKIVKFSNNLIFFYKYENIRSCDAQ